MFLKEACKSMCKNPYFSVVIPVYNSEKYLDECISSVMSQRMKDFELILVDDESSDNSPAICDKWAKDYPHMIKVIHQKNTGVYIAKRNGIKATKGNYIHNSRYLLKIKARKHAVCGLFLMSKPALGLYLVFIFTSLCNDNDKNSAHLRTLRL